MSGFQQKWQGMLQGEKKQSEGTTEESELDSDMAEMLELSYWEFKISMINMLKALMEKVDKM